MPKSHYKIGTLIKDMGKIGVIYRMIESGTLKTAPAVINWRFNYEIYYFDGCITIMGHSTLNRLIESGNVEVIKSDDLECIIESVIEAQCDV